jgi:DNA-binding transcriptional LysR family regulator
MKIVSHGPATPGTQGIDLRQLAYFRVVAQERHFGRAAARLAMSQPPLSVQVRLLEQRLGVALLDRHRRGVTPTAAGAALAAELEQFFPRFADMLQRVLAASRGETGALRIGFVTPAEYSFLPAGIREFRARHPAIGLSLSEMTSDAQFAELADGSLDAGFVLPPVPTGLAWRRVLREPLVLALPAREARARCDTEGPVRLAVVSDLPLLIFPRDKAPGLHDAIVGMFTRAGLTPVIGQQAIQMQTIVSLVAAGLGMAVVPASLRHLRREGVVYRQPAGRVPQVDVALAWRADRAAPALDRFLGHWAAAPRDAPRPTAHRAASR